jgi:hypothetical protein
MAAGEYQRAHEQEIRRRVESAMNEAARREAMLVQVRMAELRTFRSTSLI